MDFILAAGQGADGINWSDVVLVAMAPIAALIGVGITLRHNRNRDFAEMRRVAYLKWLLLHHRVVGWLAAATKQEEETFGDITNEVGDVLDEISLIGSRSVVKALTDWVKVFKSLKESPERQQLRELPDEEQDQPMSEEKRAALRSSFSSQLEPASQAVFGAMRRDIGAETPVWRKILIEAVERLRRPRPATRPPRRP